MKHLATFLFAGALAGCASLPGQTEPPHYSYSQQAMIAQGFPVEHVAMPSGFEFADIYEESRRQSHERADDPGSAQIDEHGVSWVNRSGSTAVATVLHQRVGAGSYWQPWLGADGYEFVGGRKFQYLSQAGPYLEVSGDPASTPPQAPECAVNTILLTHSRDRQEKTIFTYTEGRPCSELAALGERDAEQLRQQAYTLFGLQ